MSDAPSEELVAIQYCAGLTRPAVGFSRNEVKRKGLIFRIAYNTTLYVVVQCTPERSKERNQADDSGFLPKNILEAHAARNIANIFKVTFRLPASREKARLRILEDNHRIAL